MGRAAKLKAQRKAMHQSPEFKKEVARRSKKAVYAGMNQSIDDFVHDNCEMILAVLHVRFGWGKKRLKRFMDSYNDMINDMKEFYEVTVDDLPSPCSQIVKRTGFDIREWEDQRDAIEKIQ